MIDASRAYEIMQAQVNNNAVFGGTYNSVEITRMWESPDVYIFGMRKEPDSHVYSGCYTVSKETGEVGFMGLSKCAEAVKNGVNELDLDTIKAEVRGGGRP